MLLFGPEQEAFNQNVHEILFPLNVYDQPVNPNTLDEDAAWLKEHAGDRFYIEGYASSDGLLGYNLTLSNRRADWVKQALISKGIAENQIVLASAVGTVVSSLCRTRRGMLEQKPGGPVSFTRHIDRDTHGEGIDHPHPRARASRRQCVVHHLGPPRVGRAAAYSSCQFHHL